jgi:hypothetical protein
LGLSFRPDSYREQRGIQAVFFTPSLVFSEASPTTSLMNLFIHRQYNTDPGSRAMLEFSLLSSCLTLYIISLKKITMSHAFVKEEDDQWLHEIPGTLPALINYLTRENNGIRVYEKRMTIKNSVEVYEMSNGLSYLKDKNGKWQIAD